MSEYTEFTDTGQKRSEEERKNCDPKDPWSDVAEDFFRPRSFEERSSDSPMETDRKMQSNRNDKGPDDTWKNKEEEITEFKIFKEYTEVIRENIEDGRDNKEDRRENTEERMENKEDTIINREDRRGDREDRSENKEELRRYRENSRGNDEDSIGNMEDGRGNREHGRGIREDGRGYREDGRGNREDRRGTREDGRGNRENRRGYKEDGRGNREDRRGNREDRRDNREEGRGNRDDRRDNREEGRGNRDEGKGGRRDYDSRSSTVRPISNASLKTLVQQVEKYGHMLDRDMANYVLEDTRLSTLQRKLSKETEPTVAIAICLHINDCLLASENASYISKSSGLIQDSILDVMNSKGHPLLVKELCSISLGRVGALHQNFSTWGAGIWKLVESTTEDNIKALYISSFEEAIEHGDGAAEGINALIGLLKGLLEDTQKEMLVVPLMEVMNKVATKFPQLFKPVFTEVVDIAVGWFMESADLPDVRRIIGNHMISWSPFWKDEQEFAVDQVGYYVEDLLLEARTGGEDEDLEDLEDDELSSSIMDAFQYKWSSDEYTDDEKEKSAVQALAFIQMIDCVLSGINGSTQESLELPKVGVWMRLVKDITLEAIKWHWFEDLAISGLRCVLACWKCLKYSKDTNKAEKDGLAIDMLISINENLDNLSMTGVRVFMLCISDLLTCSEDLIRKMISKFLGVDSYLVRLAIEGYDTGVLQDLLNLCHAIFGQKNVLVLQDMYAVLLERYEVALANLISSKPFLERNDYSHKNMSSNTAKNTIMFVLAALSNLATNKGSLLSVWALEPSLFNLLSQHSGLHNSTLAMSYPAIHHSILRMLLLHSSAHHFYQSSSSLLGSLATSPTSENLSVLMTSLANLMTWTPSSQTVKSLALRTLHTILVMLKPNASAFTDKDMFDMVFKACVKLMSSSQLFLKDCLRIFILLVEDYPIRENHLKVISYVVTQAFMIGDEPVRQMALKILSKIPLELQLSKLDKTLLIKYNLYNDQDGQSLSKCLAKSYSAEDISAADVKEYLLYLSGDEKNVSWLALPDITDGHHEYSPTTEIKYTILSWLTAQFCVLNKLKSPIGKPQETLGHIDVACKRLAAKSAGTIDIRQGKAMVKLILFLEKSMSNAGDGSISALPKANKSASMFFYANKKTCQDWLDRVRGNVMKIAYLVGEYHEVVRHAWALLPYIQRKGDLDKPLGFQLIYITCLALTRLGSASNIDGIHAWIRDFSRTKFKWIPGLADFARGRLEDGIKTMTTFMATLPHQMIYDPSELESMVLPMLNSVVIKGHEELTDDTNYIAWMKKYQEENGKSISNSPTQNQYLMALANFDDGIIPPVVESIESNPILEQDSGISGLLGHLNLNLMQAGLQIQKNYMKTNSNWNDNFALTQKMNNATASLRKLLKIRDLTEHDKELCLIYNIIWHEIQCIKNKGSSQLNNITGMFSTNLSSTSLQLIKSWSQFLLKYNKQSQEMEGKLLNFKLEITRRARREDNLNLAATNLTKSFPNGQNNLDDYVRNFDIFSNQVSSGQVAMLRQASKVLLRSGKENSSDNAVAMLSGLACIGGQGLLNLRYLDPDGKTLPETSRALLNLANTLQNDSKLFERMYPDPKTYSMETATVNQILQLEGISPGSRDSLSKHIPISKIASEDDLVIGRLLRLSVLQDPRLAKAWKRLGDWAYEIGQKVVEDSIKNNHKVELTNEEISTLKTLVPTASETSVQKIMNIISQVKLRDSHLAGYEYEKWDFMRRELKEVSALNSVSDATFKAIIDVWNYVFKRTYAYYDLAGEAYVKYLTLSGDEPVSGTISASLKILHLTINHTMELQDIQRGLSITPSAQWKAIIPQLFSRLNHSVPVVRQRISDLLCRISSKYPELIIFPAVVGSLKTGTQATQTITNIFAGSLLQSKDDQPMETENEGQMGSALMLNAYEKIVEQLKKTMPTAVEQVTSFVTELRRITVLWDELWLGTLAQYGPEVQRRINRFQQETQRLDSNASLSEDEKLKLVKEKYSILFTPIIYALDQVNSITKAEPETPNEENFRAKNGALISEFLESVRNPVDWTKPCVGWTSLSALQKALGTRVSKKNLLKLSEISPALYSLRNTEIMMPGDHGAGKQHTVQIARFEGTMSVLPTKTKPKKFSLIGTDGRKYTYLFKGLEDLHLDERIMQFLAIVNQMMAAKPQINREANYFARNYTVIPLGSRSGLIQWVEGAMPLFTLYKKWQLRQQEHLENVRKSEEAAKIIGKPSEVFFAKLLPLLRKHGVSKMEDRKSWPISIMKQVLQELVQETPKHLLSNELWLRCVTGEQWWNLIQNMGSSIAVMSVIGYIIGLGDRHLDNILVNIDKGYIVHIDYNISFEKGKILRIPERVPCRLTQNIVSVFGVSGVEGIFRMVSEHTLERMREHKETLLTLLEAFVYDPLIDWTPGLTGGLTGAMYGGGLGQEEAEKKEMEHTLTFSMLGVRVTELKGAWIENQHDLQAALIQIEEGLGNWQDLEASTLRTGDKLASLHKNMSYLKEAEVNPNHRLYSIIDAYRKQKSIENGIGVVKSQLQNYITECEKIQHLYNRAVSSIGGPQLTKWDGEISRISDTNKTKCSRTVATFLENAGQRELLMQYEAVESKLQHGISSLLEQLKRILEQFSVYSAVTSVCPCSGKERHRIQKYVSWGNRLVSQKDTFSVDIIDVILTEFTSLFAPQVTAEIDKVEQVQKMNLHFEKINQMNITAQQKLYQKLMAENLMKPQRNGIIEELSRTRDVMMTQLNHPDSGIQADTLVTFFLNQLGKVVTSWMDVDRGLKEDKQGPRIESKLDAVVYQACTASTIINSMELLNLGSSSVYCKVIDSLFQLVSCLRELETGVISIIFPEGVKKHVQGDSSLFEMTKSILSIVSTGGLSLEEIKHELRLHTRSVMLGMTPTNSAIVQTVLEMKKIWTKVISSAAAADNMSTGQMLVCAVSTLLDKVDTAFMKLREDTINTPNSQEFSNISSVLTAGEMLTAAFNPTPGVNTCIALNQFVLKLEFMEQFFKSCKSFATVFNLQDTSSMFPSSDHFLAIVRGFITEYMRTFLVGVGPYYLSCAVAQFAQDLSPGIIGKLTAGKSSKIELSKVTEAVYMEKLNSGALNQARVAKSNALIKNFMNAVNRWCAIQQYETGLEIVGSCQKLFSLLQASLQWFYTEYLGFNTKLAKPNRNEFLPILTNSSTRSQNLLVELQDLIGSYVELKATVDQRLKWAAGANPQLQEVADTFSAQNSANIDNIRLTGLLVKSMRGICDAVLHYELLSTNTPDSQASDHEFFKILSLARESAVNVKDAPEGMLLETEEIALLDMNPPKDKIDRFWIRQTEEIIGQSIRSVQERVVSMNKECSSAVRGLAGSATFVKDLLTVHHKLMADVAVLLRTIQRIENLDFPTISEYLTRYKDFTENLNNLVRTLLSDQLSLDKGRLTSSAVERLKDETVYIYEHLVRISTMARDETLVQELLKSRKLKEDDTGSKEEQVEERSAAKKVEERNKFALNVLKRVRLKLEGREPDTLRRSTVNEQVDFIIRESTNHENLALMYEGWTAWI